MKIKTLLLLLAISFYISTISSAQQTNVAPQGSDQDVEAQLSQVLSLRDSIQRSIESVTRELAEIATLDIGTVGIDRIRRPFIIFREQMQVVIDQFNDQGDLATALDAATTRATTNLSWWRRQPPSPDRDSIIAELQTSLQTFERFESTRIEASNKATRELSQLLAQQLQAERIAQTRRFRDVARQLEGVITQMSEMTNTLSSMRGGQRSPGS